jgi:hypothetical protein
MPFYTVVRPAAALNTATDILTITAAATKPLNIWSVDINGQGTSSLAGELKLARSTGGTGSPTAITTNTDLWIFSVNANGGKDRFPGYPQPIPVPAGGQVSLRPLIGTHNVDQVWLIEEMG